HLRAEPLDEVAANLRIAPKQTVHNLVTRPRRRTVARKRLERRALAGADSTGDRDCEWALRVSARRTRARRGPALRRPHPDRLRRLCPRPRARLLRRGRGVRRARGPAAPGPNR